jgi:hypothetical protein
MKVWRSSLAVALVGCTKVAAVKSPAPFIETTQPQRVWVTRQNGDTAEIGIPRVVGDTLFGFRGTSFQEIPLQSIKEVRAVQSAPARTAAIVIAASVVAGAAYWTMNSKSSSQSSTCMGGEEEIC